MVDLTKEGYVDRTRGKGTFVRERKLVEKIQILGSFHGVDAPAGARARWSRVLSDAVTEAAPDDVADALGLRGRRRPGACAGSPCSTTYRSRCWPPGSPRSYQKGVAAHDLGEGSLYDALAEVHGVEMTSADNLVEVDRAGLDDADLLGLTPGSPLLRGRRRHP